LSTAPPRAVEELPREAMSVACGDGHCAVVDVALCAFTWGENFYNQCGLRGDAAATMDVSRATRFDSFDGTPIMRGDAVTACDDSHGCVAAASCGAWCTALLTASGDVYTTSQTPDVCAAAALDATSLQSCVLAGGDGIGVGGGSAGTPWHLVRGLPPDIVHVAAGARHFVATTAGGDAFVWGVAAVPGRLEEAPASSIGPPVSAARKIDASCARLVGAVGAREGWGLLRVAPPTRVPLEELVRASGGGGGRVRAVGARASKGTTALSLETRVTDR
jgi:hypothetical protein